MLSLDPTLNDDIEGLRNTDVDHATMQSSCEGY